MTNITENTPEIPRAPRRNRCTAIGLLVLMFILGIVTGVGGGALVLRHKLRQQAFSLTNDRSPGDYAIKRAEKEISKGLKLSTDELTAVKAELEITRDRIHEIRRRTVTDVRATILDTIERIKARLPSDKRAMLDEKARKHLTPWGVYQKN